MDIVVKISTSTANLPAVVRVQGKTFPVGK